MIQELESRTAALRAALERERERASRAERVADQCQAELIALRTRLQRIEAEAATQHWAARHRQAEVAAWGMAARIELLAWRTGNPVTRALRALRRAY